MSSKVEACAECTRRCIQLHRKTENLSCVNSFFKVMVGDLFSKVLYLPPKFAATVSTLVNKKVALEDSRGQQWQVTVSNSEGALAFEEGWSAFFSEHGIEIGDLVIFNHIMDLHFYVKIYTKTGCEKVEFCRNNNPRKRTCSAFETMDKGASRMLDNDERHRPLHKTENFDDSFILRNKDVGLEENRSPIVDLFSMEMQKNDTSSNENQRNKVAGVKIRPTLVPTPLTTTRDTGPVNKAQIVKEEKMEIPPLNTFDNETIDERHFPEAVDVKITVSDKDACHDKTIRVPFVTSAMDSDKNVEYVCDSPFKVVKEFQVEPVSDEKHTLPTNNSPSAEHEYTTSSLGVQKLLPGEVTKIIKQEPLEMIPEVDSHEDLIQGIWEPKVIAEELIEKSNKIDGDNNDVHKVVNADNGDSGGFKSPSAAHIFCLVAKDTRPFLDGLEVKEAFKLIGGHRIKPFGGHLLRILSYEFSSVNCRGSGGCCVGLVAVLPTCLPSSKKGRRNMEKKKLVYLRDPGKRLWPIFYHEMPEIQVLTSGWEAFSSANQIQTGDECLFQVEDEFERIYEVSIRKCKQ